MKKEVYTKPVIDVISFETEDIITESITFTVDSVEVNIPALLGGESR